MKADLLPIKVSDPGGETDEVGEGVGGECCLLFICF